MNQQVSKSGGHYAEEQMSWLMDGELPRDQTRFLLKRVASDGQLSACWARFHIIRQVLRKHELVVLSGDFADRVWARIEADSTLSISVRRGPWLRWASGSAIAASVAIAALLVTQPATNNKSSTDNQVATVAAVRSLSPASAGPLASSPAAASTAPPEFRLPLAASMAIPASASTTDFSQPGMIDQRLQSYLLRHYQATAPVGQSSVVPYLLIATPPRQEAIIPAPAGGENR
ncbi:MAG: sigma-E factor negative regulatory protein [Dokdonella sp.]